MDFSGGEEKPGKRAEAWLIGQLGEACLRATEFEDRKLGVDLWVKVKNGNKNVLVPVQITINNDPKVIRQKWHVSARRGIVFVKFYHSQIRRLGGVRAALNHFWRMVNKAIKNGTIFTRKIGEEGYQLPLPWFAAVDPEPKGSS